MKEKIDAGISGIIGGTVIVMGIADLIELIKPLGMVLLGAVGGFIICYKAEEKRQNKKTKIKK